MRNVPNVRLGKLAPVATMLLACAATLSAVEPETIRRSVEIAESERPGATAIGAETVPGADPPVLSVELDDGTEMEIRIANLSVFRSSRPLFTRRQRRVGRAVDSLPSQEVGLSEAYRTALDESSVASTDALSTDAFQSVDYVLNRERLLIRVDFAGTTIYVNPRTGDVVEP